jgi:putative ABC transport system permease protein
MWKEPPPEEMDAGALREYFLAGADRLASRPEVEGVAISTVAEAHLLMEDFATALVERADGTPLRVAYNSVTPGYFELLSIPVTQGRSIEARDVEGALPVAVVNEAFLERFMPEGQGLGEPFQVTAFYTVETQVDRPATTYQVVGVVPNRTDALGQSHRPFFWTSFLQETPVRGVYHAKGRVSAEEVIPILRQEVPPDPNEFVLVEAGSYRDYVDYRFMGHRIVSRVLGFAGIFSLILAFIGVYGIVSFAVSQRLREMAIRQAVGAEKNQVIRAVMADGLRPTAFGIVVGLGVAIPLAFLARSALLGVLPLDPIAVGGGTLLLVSASLLAGVVPARRLLRTHPMEILREE